MTSAAPPTFRPSGSNRATSTPRPNFWAVGILLYEMVSGVQPFQAPDTRRLEQRIRARRPPALIDDRCPVALQAVIARLLAGNVADRYGSAVEIRDDLQRFVSGQETEAQRDGWPAREHDEAATRRTHRPRGSDEEATRRTIREPAPASKEQPKVEPRVAAAPSGESSSTAAAGTCGPPGAAGADAVCAVHRPEGALGPFHCRGARTECAPGSRRAQ